MMKVLNTTNPFVYMAYFICRKVGGDLTKLDPRIVHFEFDGGTALSGHAAEPFEHGRDYKYMSTHVEGFGVHNEYLGGCDGEYLQEFDQSLANTEDGEFALTVEELTVLVEGDARLFMERFEASVSLAESILGEFEKKAAEALTLGREFAKRNGLPFIVNVEGKDHDMHKLQHVDWDSSSMHC